MKPAEWQQHIDAYLQTNGSKHAYAKEHNLVYSQFLYWLRKHTDKQSDNSDVNSDTADDFVRVTAQTNHQNTDSNLGTMIFPGGMRLEIHHTDLLQPLLACCLNRSV